MFVTAGASSALDLICTLYTRCGDAILVEEPSYFLALRIFEDHGLRAVPVPTDEDGLCLEELEESITVHKPKFLYTIPTFHNPSGRTLSQERRDRLVTLAQRHNMLIVADEVYHFLNYKRTPPRPFAASAGEVEQVISVNSFSKILAPGLRLGWIQAHENVIKRLAGAGLLDSGGGLNPFTSALVRNFIETGGLQKNIIHLKEEYTRRLDAMASALRQYLPVAEWAYPQGGFFCWVRLPGVDTAELRRKAAGYQVDIRQGVLFSSQQGLQEYFRLCFSFYDAAQITEGIRRLGAVVQNYISQMTGWRFVNYK